MSKAPREKDLSLVEAELYDRQIRLWGVLSQQRLRKANVLLVGIRGLGAEIAKNILLSGINSLTILDDGVVTEEDYTKNFLLDKNSIGQKIAEAVFPKARRLNPLVKITVDTEGFLTKSEEYFTQFTIIIGTRLKSKDIRSIDVYCKKHNIQFICGDVFGMFGCSIADFLEHEYYEDVIQFDLKKRRHNGEPVEEFEKSTHRVQNNMTYPALENVLPESDKELSETPKSPNKRINVLYYLMRILLKFRDENDRDPLYENKEEDIKKLKVIREEILQLYQVDGEKLKEDIFDLVFGEIASICAIIGGIVAQEVIKAVSHKEVPINNLFLLDPYTFSGKEEFINI